MFESFPSFTAWDLSSNEPVDFESSWAVLPAKHDWRALQFRLCSFDSTADGYHYVARAVVVPDWFLFHCNGIAAGPVDDRLPPPPSLDQAPAREPLPNLRL